MTITLCRPDRSESIRIRESARAVEGPLYLLELALTRRLILPVQPRC